MYRLLQYLKYRWTAKSRHGVHSPFVYDFIEKVLRKQHGPLKERIADYLGAERITWIDAKEQLPASVNTHSIVIVNGIHNSPENLAAWQEMYNQGIVTLSIDAFHYGILLFSQDFKEKQHFIVKG